MVRSRMTVADVLENWLTYEFQKSGFRFDKSAARYRDNRTGQFVAEQKILNTVVELGPNKNSFGRLRSRKHDEHYPAIRRWQD